MFHVEIFKVLLDQFVSFIIQTPPYPNSMPEFSF